MKLNEGVSLAKRFPPSVFFIFMMSFCGVSEGADLSIKPSIMLSEQYNDNVFLSSENKIADNITQVLPSVQISYKAPALDVKMDYSYIFWHYWKLNSNKDTHNLDLSSKITAIENFLYFDMSDRYYQAVLSPKMPSEESNPFTNQTAVNALNLSPYIKYQINPLALFSTGYKYTNIWYKETGALNRQQHTGFASIKYVLGENVSAYAGIEYMADRPEGGQPGVTVQADSNDQRAAYLRLTYKVDPNTNFDGTIGHRSIDFQLIKSTSSVTYTAVLSRRFAEDGQIELKADSTFTTDPLLGVENVVTEGLSIKYGKELQVRGDFVHRREKYIESSDRIDSIGVTTNVTYRIDDRLTLKVSASYERRKFTPEETPDNVYRASAEITRMLAKNTSLGLIYSYHREQSVSEANDITNNIVSVQFRHTF